MATKRPAKRSVRPAQQVDLLAVLDEHGYDSGDLEELLWTLFVPPNLRFLGFITSRLLKLREQHPDWLGQLPGRLDSSGTLRSIVDQLLAIRPILVQRGLGDVWLSPDEVATPGSSGPLFGYCVTEFPIWSAMIHVPLDPKHLGVCGAVMAEFVGRSMRHVYGSVSRDQYVTYLDQWQLYRAKHADEDTEEERRPSHPVPHIAALAAAERAFREIGQGKYSAEWDRIHLPPSHETAELGSLLSNQGILSTVPDLAVQLRKISQSLNLLGFAPKPTVRRTVRRGDQKRRSLTGGRFLDGLDLQIEAGEGDIGKASFICQLLPPEAGELIDEDFDLGEICAPGGEMLLHDASDDDVELPSMALRIRTTWHLNEEMARNQLLPWSLDELTEAQLKTFASRVLYPEIGALSWDQLAAVMYVHAVFATGKRQQLVEKNLCILNSLNDQPLSPVAFAYNHHLWRVKVNQPDLVMIHDGAHPDWTPENNYLTLADHFGFHQLAYRWLALLPSIPQAADEINKPIVRALKVLWDELRREGITEAKLSRALPRFVHRQSGDLAYIALWSDWLPSITRTQLHYLSPRADIIERAVDRHASTMADRILPADADRVIPEIRCRPEGNDRVGMANCPTHEEVVRLTAEFQEELAIDPGYDLRMIERYSNAYVCYSAAFQSQALGYRAAIDPSPQFLKIGELTLAIFEDKNSEGYHRRIVVVPRSYVEHQANLARHLDLIRGAFRSLTEEGAPEMVWLSRFRAHAFAPKHFTQHLESSWPYKINAFRRRMRTCLTEREAPGEVIDIWMSQWKLGNCPWMHGSAFQIRELEDLVRNHIEPILEEDGWKPLPSLLHPSSFERNAR